MEVTGGFYQSLSVAVLAFLFGVRWIKHPAAHSSTPTA